MRTEGKNWKGQHPSYLWIRRILLAEHSPIRAVEYRIEWTDIPYWVVMHLVRHHVGITNFVATQRSDRTGINRDNLPQNNRISYSIRLNAQAIINISRKRLCSKASLETRAAWKLALDKIKAIDLPLYLSCVPECIYRGGFCTEIRSCGKYNNNEFNTDLKTYRGDLNATEKETKEKKSQPISNCSS